MSCASNTLTDIIDRSFNGKKILLAKSSDMTAESITRLTQGRTFTPHTLEKICEAIPPDDARALCHSVCRDLIPAEYKDDLIIIDNNLKEDQTPYITGPQLDDHSEKIIKKIKQLAATEPETKAWLHRLGKWMLE